MPSIQVVGLGMAALDILIRLKEMPTWEKSASLRAVAIDGGGPVATAIVAMSRLGVSVGFVGTCGSDRLGQIKRETLIENGVDVSHLVQRPDPENQVVLVNVHEETGERLFSGYKGRYGRSLSPEELDRDYITSAAYLHLDGYHPDAALQAARWMRAAGKKVVLDGSATREPVAEHMQRLVRETDVLICGSGFGPALTGQDGLWAAGEAILAMGPEIVVQTEGKDGSYTVTANERFHIPSFDVDVLDTTGCGDVFHGAFIVGQLQGWDLCRTVRFATAVSAMKCTQLGGRAGIPTFQGALSFLHERGFMLQQRR